MFKISHPASGCLPPMCSLRSMFSTDDVSFSKDEAESPGAQAD
jgi:hypothetical protein